MTTSSYDLQSIQKATTLKFFEEKKERKKKK